jgi:membrane complex biogenesis BtpA family protein
MDAAGLVASLFGRKRALVGVLHLPPLPGSPRAGATMDAIVEDMVAEARTWTRAGAHGLIIENMHDRPYPRAVAAPETVAAMAVVGREVRRETPLPLGVQVLAGANREALAVALACGAAFVRVEGFVFAHVADEGIIQGCAAELMRARRAMGAEHVKVFADIKKKHSAHAITADVDIEETAHAAEFFLADGVVVTGARTGLAADADEVRRVARACTVPVLVGSGITPANLASFEAADAFIVGSAAKRDGVWSGALEEARIERLVRALEAAS